MTMNKMHIIHTLICYIYLKKYIFDSVILVCGMSILWEDTDGCAKQYMCDLDIYLMSVLSYSFGIIMDCSVNAPGHGYNYVDVINAMDKRYLK